MYAWLHLVRLRDCASFSTGNTLYFLWVFFSIDGPCYVRVLVGMLLVINLLTKVCFDCQSFSSFFCLFSSSFFVSLVIGNDFICYGCPELNKISRFYVLFFLIESYLICGQMSDPAGFALSRVSDKGT